MKNNRYEANETMRFLGHQYLSRMMGQNEFLQLKDILEAHGLHLTRYYEAAADAYILGFVNGQRSERARKRK